jgi:deoxyxylulose-5-phosphate synthase
MRVKNAGEKTPELLVISWPNEYIPQGEIDELFTFYGLDAPNITQQIARKFSEMRAI